MYSEKYITYAAKVFDADPYDPKIKRALQLLHPETIFRCTCEWNGLLGDYDVKIKNWIRDIYGLDIDDWFEMNKMSRND